MKNKNIPLIILFAAMGTGMRSLTELQQERAEKVNAQNALVTEVRTAKADFTEDQEIRFDALNTEIEALDKQIARAKKVEIAEKRAADLSGKRSLNHLKVVKQGKSVLF